MDNSTRMPERTSLEEEQKIMNVPISVIEQQDFNREIITQGKIKSRFRSDVAFEINEQITAIHIRTGEYVKKGQLLAELQDVKYRLALEKVEQQMQQAQLKIEEKLISLGYELGKDTIPPQLLERLSIQYNIGGYENEKKLANHNLAQTRIYAPISGVVANLEAQAGNYSSRYKKLCTIIDNRNLQVVFPILETELMEIEPGMPLLIKPLYQVEKKYRGKVAAINPEVNEFGMLEVMASIDNTDRYLLEGMKVQVYLQKEIPGQLVVTKKAVVDKQGKQVVFTYEGGHAHWNYVEIEHENSDYYTIKKGLESRDTIIVDQNLYLVHLEKVNPVFSQSQPNE